MTIELVWSSVYHSINLLILSCKCMFIKLEQELLNKYTSHLQLKLFCFQSMLFPMFSIYAKMLKILKKCFNVVRQSLPVLAALSLVAVSVLYLLCRGSGGTQKKKKLPVTLQDATLKYPLRLIDKEVDWKGMQTYKWVAVSWWPNTCMQKWVGAPVVTLL